MQNRIWRATQRINSALDQFCARLCQNLNGDIIRDMPTFDQLTQKVKICVRCGWKPDFDFPKTHVHQHLEHHHFAGAVHRLNQRLIAIA